MVEFLSGIHKALGWIFRTVSSQCHKISSPPSPIKTSKQTRAWWQLHADNGKAVSAIPMSSVSKPFSAFILEIKIVLVVSTSQLAGCRDRSVDVHNPSTQAE